MKKTYCDRCGREMEQNDYLMLHKGCKKGEMAFPNPDEFFDICPACRESFFGWLNGIPAEQEKPVKVAEAKPAEQEVKEADKPADKPANKPAKNSVKDKDKSNAYTAQYIAEVTGAPASTVRRHMEGICSTYGKDKQGRTVRYYHMTEAQLCRLCENIKERKQGQRTKI
jgi:hypothetical protein